MPHLIETLDCERGNIPNWEQKFKNPTVVGVQSVRESYDWNMIFGHLGHDKTLSEFVDSGPSASENWSDESPTRQNGPNEVHISCTERRCGTESPQSMFIAKCDDNSIGAAAVSANSTSQEVAERESRCNPAKRTKSRLVVSGHHYDDDLPELTSSSTPQAADETPKGRVMDCISLMTFLTKQGKRYTFDEAKVMIMNWCKEEPQSIGEDRESTEQEDHFKKKDNEKSTD